MRFVTRSIRRGQREVENETHVVSVAFLRDYWREHAAEEWLLDRDFVTAGGGAKGEWLVYPQRERDEQHQYRTVAVEREAGSPSVTMVVGVPGRPGVQVGRRA